MYNGVMFSVIGKYPAVGLFSTTHLITLVVSLFVIMLLVASTKRMSRKKYIILLRVFAIIFTCLEATKIIWSICNGFTLLDSWFPLYFCSLFIYALWLTWFKNEKVQELGLSFIGFGGIVAGIIFMVIPLTSFRWYPIFHFQCLYSALFHSTMIYMGILAFTTKSIKVNLKTIFKYCLFTFAFIMLAIGINLIFKSNLMFLSNPSSIPLGFLKSIYNYSQLLYCALMVFAHTLLIGFGMAAIIKTAGAIHSKKQSKKR